jgi:hypothetical protein
MSHGTHQVHEAFADTENLAKTFSYTFYYLQSIYGFDKSVVDSFIILTDKFHDLKKSIEILECERKDAREALLHSLDDLALLKTK